VTNNDAINALLKQTAHRIDVINSALLKAQSDAAQERVAKFAG
jgi:hypothetical protein